VREYTSEPKSHEGNLNLDQLGPLSGRPCFDVKERATELWRPKRKSSAGPDIRVEVLKQGVVTTKKDWCNVAEATTDSSLWGE